MAPYQFRLARALDWYAKQCQVEEERLRLCAERAVRARAEIDDHQKSVLAQQMELIQTSRPETHELASLEPFRRGAKQQELRLRRNCIKYEQELDSQRGVAQAARRRVRLVENLRDRRLVEYRYEADRELEALAAETHLAGFARALAGKPSA
jgi:hypothetical protein